MSDETAPGERFPTDEEASWWFASVGLVVAAGGVIPDEHEGLYEPSAEELREGFRATLRLNTQVAEQQVRIAEAGVSSLFEAGTMSDEDDER